MCLSEFALRTSGLPLCVTHLPSSFNSIAKFVTQVVMSLSIQSVMLTSNATASGRKVTLTNNQRTKWLPQNQDFNVMITGAVPAKSQPSLKLEGASSDTSTASEVGGMNATSTAGVGSEVKREKGVTTQDVVAPQYVLTPGKSVVKTGLAETGGNASGDDENGLDNQQLAVVLQRLEIMNRTKELEHAQLLRDTEFRLRVRMKYPA